MFSNLSTVTLQLTTDCNLSCDYCFQDACTLAALPGDGRRVTVDAGEAAGVAVKLLEMSGQEMTVVFSGGEPMLAPAEWYETFFRAMDGYLEGSGKAVDYSVQTNISILRPDVLDLFIRYGVHFSVHYDGELDDPKLLSKKRRDNIVKLRERGCPVTVLVVGTEESLKALPSTIEFFNRHGIRFYRINYVSSQGRGHQVSMIPPSLRAEAEFEAAFMASQYDFGTRDQVVTNKFLFYYNNVICESDHSGFPRPQKCRAGIASAYVGADGYIYPCSFFPSVTGPVARAADLPAHMENAERAIALCEEPNPYYDGKCKACSAMPICGEYCALSPITDTNFMESFCSAQRALRSLMDENREISELIAKRFIEHKRTYPADIPRSCGILTGEE